MRLNLTGLLRASAYSLGLSIAATSTAWALSQPVLAPDYAVTSPPGARVPFKFALGGALSNTRVTAPLARVELDPPEGTRGAGSGLERVFESRCRSVVYIIAVHGEGADQAGGTGTGAIVTPEGHVLTAAHVIAGADQIGVGVFSNCAPGAKPDLYKASLLRVDQVADLALLKLDKAPQNLSVMPFGDLKSVRTGSQVVIIGHPKNLLMSMSTGVVSAIRPNFAFSEDGKQHATVIQTDGALNPGNSGGPMMTPKGELIGVNSFIFGQASAGLNFAVSVNDVRTMLSRSSDRYLPGKATQTQNKAPANEPAACKSKVLKEWTEDGAKRTLLDVGCKGRGNAVVVEPQAAGAKPYVLIDRNEDGKADVIYHLDAQGNPETSEWDDDYDGTIDYQAEHANGEWEPKSKTRVAG